MHTINSISGGKTSSYMAVHYPANYNLFSLVRIEDAKCTPKDNSLVKIVSDKIGMDFIATAESDITLRAVLDLEQLLGKEIIWVTGMTFEQSIKSRGGKYLPNMMARYCTSLMKMKPIFDWCQDKFGGEKVIMNIGYRYDEMERGFDISTGLQLPEKPFKTIIGKSKNLARNRWGLIDWRYSKMPLIEDKINHFHVVKWANQSGIIFPKDSNCVGCFWKSPQQLRKNWEDEPNKMQWFSDQETPKKKFKKEMTYEQIRQIGLQSEFMFGEGSGCQAGFCTD